MDKIVCGVTMVLFIFPLLHKKTPRMHPVVTWSLHRIQTEKPQQTAPFRALRYGSGRTALSTTLASLVAL